MFVWQWRMRHFIPKLTCRKLFVSVSQPISESYFLESEPICVTNLCRRFFRTCTVCMDWNKSSLERQILAQQITCNIKSGQGLIVPIVHLLISRNKEKSELKIHVTKPIHTAVDTARNMEATDHKDQIEGKRTATSCLNRPKWCCHIASLYGNCSQNQFINTLSSLARCHFPAFMKAGWQAAPVGGHQQSRDCRRSASRLG